MTQDILAAISFKLGLKDLIKEIDSHELGGFDKAVLFDALGQHEEVVPIYIKWLKENPNDQSALNNLAYDYITLNRNIDEAERIARQVSSSLTHPEEKANALDTLAFALFRQRKHEEAKTALDESIRLRSDKIPHPEHLFRYSLILEKLGQNEEAFKYLSRAYEFYLNDEKLNISEDENAAYFVIPETVVFEIFSKWGSESNKVYELLQSIEKNLRPSVCGKPESESEISNQLEVILRSQGYSPVREKIHVIYGTKTYIPDFVLPQLHICIEVKFCKKRGDERTIISQINDDIMAYKTAFKFVVFVVYDMGTIRDVLHWRKDFVSNPRVYVVVVKH
jgi:tetratricopeptide (TPR) repeat protein